MTDDEVQKAIDEIDRLEKLDKKPPRGYLYSAKVICITFAVLAIRLWWPAQSTYDSGGLFYQVVIWLGTIYLCLPPIFIWPEHVARFLVKHFPPVSED